jgi:O-antigen ligase
VRPRETLAWIVVALLFIDLTFFSGASNFLAAPQSRMLNQALILGAVLVFLLVAFRRGLDLRSPFLLPGAAWVGALALAALTSQRPAASIEALALLLIAAPAYLAVRAVLADPRLRPRLDWLVIVSTTVFVVAYLLQALTQWLSWWSIAGPSIPPLRPGDVGLTVGTVNAVALYLELLAPIAVWLSWARWRSKAFTAALSVLAVLALIVTGSRGAWLGALAGGAVAAVLAWRAIGMPMLGRPSPARALAAVGAAVVVVVLLPGLVGRMLSGDAGRLELWSAAWSMFSGSPLAGVGPGAWPGLRASTPISDDNLAVLATSHNSIFQILAETGLVGLLAAAWLALAIVRVAWRAITNREDPDGRRMAIAAAASLVAAGVHSVVDTQFHLPAIVLLVLHLVARLELAAPDATAPVATAPAAKAASRRVALAGAAIAIVGALLLVPIDVAMVRAAFGNNALDRGDAPVALEHFDAAVALHDLPAYRLGQAIAQRALGDDAGAAESFRQMELAEPFTFVTVQRAAVERSPFVHWQHADQAGPYDPTASVNLAAQRFADEPDMAASNLADAMVQVPTLYFSTRPAALFDDQRWGEAQFYARRFLEQTDPVTAAAVATLADQGDVASSLRAAVPPGPAAEALALLTAAVDGQEVDVDEARALLRRAPASSGVQFVLWQLGFAIESQPLLDAVKAVSVPLYFNVPSPPMELVTDGRRDADYSLRVPRWPMASAGRNGPKRPYIDGFITIEPVYRPKP